MGLARGPCGSRSSGSVDAARRLHRRYSGRMQARWLSALAIAATATLASPLPLSAQARGTVVVTTGRHARPASPAPQPSTLRPFPTVGVLPPVRGPRNHRPMLFRSSLVGLFAFDPYWWLDPEVGVIPTEESVLTGGLQLDVEPRRALVYVDGVLAGTVDQFKGYFQHLETTAGYHVISFLTPDYEPLTIGITVVPNKTTTYRGFLNRSNGR